MILKLYKHQISAVNFLSERGGSGAIFHQIGLGKTITALQTFHTLRESNPSLKMLVICPITLIKATWIEEVHKFYPQYKIVNLRDGFTTTGDIFICNFEYFLNEQKIKNIIDLSAKFAGNIMCAIDESSRMKNPQAKTTKVLLALKQYFKNRVVMSGTPAPNCETEYWAQINFVSDGIVNPKFSSFRNHYFHLARGTQIAQGQVMTKETMRKLFSSGFSYQITPERRTQLMQRINPVCHRANAKDCLDLPETVDEERLISMSPEQRKHYNEMKENLITEIKNEIVTADVALAKIMKLRQITSGFGINTEGEAVDIGRAPKLDDLSAVIDEVGTDQAIIWAVFRHDITNIERLLSNRCVTLYGGTKDPEESIRAFKSGEKQFLIAHPKSAGHGLTLTNAHIMIFYSYDYSWEYYEQCRGRIYRNGQKNNCVYIHLICDNSIDQEILNVLRKKQNAVAILNSYFTQR